MKIDSKAKILAVSILVIISMLGIGLTAHSVTLNQTHDTCDTPTQVVRVGKTDDFKYNVTKIEVSKGACVEISFEDFSGSSVQHSFIVMNGDQIIVDMSVSAGNTTVGKWQMPNEDLALKFYCDVPGHRDAGEQGDFIIGNPVTSQANTDGSNTDKNSNDTNSVGLNLFGFQFYITFLALISILAVFKVTRNRK